MKSVASYAKRIFPLLLSKVRKVPSEMFPVRFALLLRRLLKPTSNFPQHFPSQNEVNFS
jgi:hypothetical protein